MNVCDFCGASKALVYCKSDNARLWLSCDGHVHSANALSRRHLRSFFCESCFSKPAFVRCLEHEVSLCNSCDSNGCGCSEPRHLRQNLDSYSGGAPSERFKILFLAPGDLVDNAIVAKGGAVSLGSVSENRVSDGWEYGENGRFVEPIVASGFISEFNPWTPFFQEPNALKRCSVLKDLGIDDGDVNYECSGVTEARLNLDNSNQLFGCSQTHNEFNFEDVGSDCFSLVQNSSVPDCSVPKCSGTEALHDCLALQSSSVHGSISEEQVVNGCADEFVPNPSENRSINGGFSMHQIHPKTPLVFSSFTGKSFASDQQDGEVSPMFLTGESSWYTNVEFNPQTRDKAKMRYNGKKENKII